jgi:hypothetical protein
VRAAVLLRDLAELQRPSDVAVVAEEVVERLAGERQERRQQDLEAVDAAERDEEDRPGAFAVVLDHRPRRLLCDVLVGQRGHPHRLGDRGTEPRLLDQRADRVEPGRDPVQHRAIGLGQLAGLGHRPEVPVGVR